MQSLAENNGHATKERNQNYNFLSTVTFGEEVEFALHGYFVVITLEVILVFNLQD